MKKTIIAAMCLGSFLVPFAGISLMIMCTGKAQAAQNLPRGIQNYLDVMAGRKKLEQLSPEERQEVLTIYRRMQSQQGGERQPSDCRDARSRAEQAASELADYARRLQRCAEGQDYSDDCSTEFRRVRNAYNDYESAVSDVGNYCN